MSTSVEVKCADCGESLGDQFKPGDGEKLFRAHLADKHPADYKALRASETAVARIPWPPEQTSADARPHERGPEACWCGSLHTYADGAERTDIQRG